MIRGTRSAVVLVVVVAAWVVFRQFGSAVQVPISDDWFEALLKLSFWVAPCAIGLRMLGARTYRDVAVELGLRRSFSGYGVATAASLPILVPVLVGGAVPTIPVSVLVSTVLVSPFAEEVLFRGWLMRQLSRHCGWHPVAALVVSALAFGLAHVANLNYLLDPVPLGTASGAAAAGLLFGWLTWRWDSLWPSIGLHACMNLSSQAGGTSMATIGRFTTIALVVVLTFVFRRARSTDWRAVKAGSEDPASGVETLS